MIDSGIQTRPYGSPTAATISTCIMQASNNSADTKFARHGQFQEEEKHADYWNEYFLSKRSFRRKIEEFPGAQKRR